MDNAAVTIVPLARVERGRRQEAAALLSDIEKAGVPTAATTQEWISRLARIVAAPNYALPEIPQEQQEGGR